MRVWSRGLGFIYGFDKACYRTGEPLGNVVLRLREGDGGMVELHGLWHLIPPRSEKAEWDGTAETYASPSDPIPRGRCECLKLVITIMRIVVKCLERMA